MKKIISIVLALVLVMSFAVTAFASGTEPVEPTADYSITVKNAKAGETYTAYKMFDLSVNDPLNPTAYRYTVNDAWEAFAETSEFKAVFTVDNQGYVSSTQEDQPNWDGTSALSKVADAAAQYAKTNSITEAGHVTIADGANSGKIELTAAGYYVITSTLGTRAMIETTPDKAAVTVNEKNEEDTIEKQVKEGNDYGKSNDAQIGDTVEFKSIATITPRSINVKIHDTMSTGLTFHADSIQIFTDAELTTKLAASLYEIQAKPDEGDTFTIKIKDEFAATATEAQTLYITYTATLNEKAVVKGTDGVVIVPQTNTTKISFGDSSSSAEDQTTTKTYKFEVLKYANGVKTKLLAGATFQVKKGDTVLKLTKIDDNNYKVDPNGTLDSFTTNDVANIVIWGVDNAEYTLVETAAPDGYNMLKDPITVKVGTENAFVAEIENKSGAELPSTGGIGTTIFYVLGGLMVTGAVVVLVSKKRMEQ